MGKNENSRCPLLFKEAKPIQPCSKGPTPFPERLFQKGARHIMNKDKLTAYINVAVTPKLREALEAEACKRHRTLSSLARLLWLEALGLSSTTSADDRGNGKHEYEIMLDPDEEATLRELGYEPLPYETWKQLKFKL